MHLTVSSNISSATLLDVGESAKFFSGAMELKFALVSELVTLIGLPEDQIRIYAGEEEAWPVFRIRERHTPNIAFIVDEERSEPWSGHFWKWRLIHSLPRTIVLWNEEASEELNLTLVPDTEDCPF